MTKKERTSRVIARGEVTGHSHVITGDAIVRNINGEIIIEIGNEGAVLRHLLETDWLNGREVWTEEHADIDLSEMPGQIRHGDVLLDKVGERTYKYIQQMEFDPYNEVIRQVQD
jgi:hypothetical protein